MYSEAEFLIGLILGFGFGVALTIIVALVKQSNSQVIESSITTNTDFEQRVSPFIEIHQSLTEGTNTPSKDEGLNRLKAKVESFKHRNRFYQS